MFDELNNACNAAAESLSIFADKLNQLCDAEADLFAARVEAGCRYRYRFGHDGARSHAERQGHRPWASRLGECRN